MKLRRLSSLLLLGTTLFSSCLKQQFDNPPDTSHFDPQIPVNAQIGDFATSALNLQAGKSRIIGDSTIYGIVVGDDRSGNLYKQIIIEDSAGFGIAVILDKTNLYGDYPVGRKVYIKLNGLYLANYKGLPEIVYAVDATGSTSGIPSSLIAKYVIPASFPNTITPATVTLSALFSNPGKYMNTLVKLENMEFDAASAGVLYSSPNSSTSRTLKDCPNTGSLVMYNSSYASFQSAITPTGKGSITGIFSLYNTPQFLLRDTTDVHFTGVRECQ